MIKVLDPSLHDSESKNRGGGRFIALLREYLSNELEFVPDFSHIHPQDTLLIPFWKPFDPPLLAKRLCKKQYIVIFDAIPLKYPQHFPIGMKGKLNLLRNIFSLTHFDKVITISHTAKSDLHEYLNLPKNKIEVVYLTASSIFTKKTHKMPANAHSLSKSSTLPNKFVLYVGDVNWNKNLLTIAEGARLSKTPCVFVGKPFGADLKAMQQFKSYEVNPWQKPFFDFAHICKDNPYCITLGYVSDDDLIQLYQKAIANVLFSFDEGFGLSYIEASTQKCPSILSDIPVFREIAGKSAIFANPNNAPDLAQAIEKLEQNPQEIKNYGERAQRQFQKFDPTHFKRSLISNLV